MPAMPARKVEAAEVPSLGMCASVGAHWIAIEICHMKELRHTHRKNTPVKCFAPLPDLKP